MVNQIRIGAVITTIQAKLQITTCCVVNDSTHKKKNAQRNIQQNGNGSNRNTQTKVTQTK